jgi:hypothetical protein
LGGVDEGWRREGWSKGTTTIRAKAMGRGMKEAPKMHFKHTAGTVTMAIFLT